MSWWTKVRDGFEKVATAGMYDPVKSRQNEAEQRYAIGDQVQAYRDQTKIANDQIDQKRGEEQVEKRRIQEKQIRSLRHNFKPAGFLDSGSSDGMSDKLGG